ncbi:hypothetical protein GSI_04626 [Ganoderma sinense ZZ0214-1]|uniref:Uncharacterized protein n=1 Tax=Ganoderma sinense ZZ0214-1 TaxID=1077348 RepID=A0A2G8SHD4_9APHY|nr:hypothetical protein GSI_04626 [Ganoderma sinense ZZ0214-1]
MERQGRTLTRCVDMFIPPAAVIYAGTGEKFDPALEVFDVKIPLLQRYWRELLYLSPSLEADLQGLDMQGYMDASAAMLRQRVQTNADDARSISLAVVDWLADDLKAAGVWLTRGTRADRGFQNVVTGRYLCPIFLDYDNKTVREDLLRGTLPFTAGGLPTFLFDLEKFDLGAPWKSLLRGPLIVLAWYHIFDRPYLRERAYKMSLPYTSVARSHGMIQVTIGSILYATTLVHLALSTTTSMHHEHSDVRALHKVLVDFVNDPDNLDIVESLLRWWNRY